MTLLGITASIGYPADEGLPQLDLFAKGTVDVTRKSATQQINQGFSPKYQKAPGWKKTFVIDGFIMGIAASWKVIKTDILLTG